MARKLGLALIGAGIIGTYAGWWNLNNSCEISKRIRNEFKYTQTGDKKEIEVANDPRMNWNSAYGGFSAAGTLASIFAVAGGGYLFVKRNCPDSE